MRISVTKLQRGACLKLIFSYKEGGSPSVVVSDAFNINDLAEVRFKFEEKPPSILYAITWRKHDSVPKSSTIKINVLCESEQQILTSQQVLCQHGWMSWTKLGEYPKQITQTPFASALFGAPKSSNVDWEFNALEISMSVIKVETITFAKLYEDEDFCDFNLTTIDGSASVPVHKTCLIVHSDMFKTMLSVEWKETINGCIKIPGVTLQSLNYLKEYMYLGTLPDDTMQLQSLLLIAKCYMIENLKTECVMKLAVTVNPEEFHSLQEFAMDNRISELVQAIVQITPDRTVQGAHQIKKDEEAGPPQAKKRKGINIIIGITYTNSPSPKVSRAGIMGNG